MNPSLNLNNTEIERIIHLVVEQLVREGAPSTAVPAKPAPAGELRLDARLITLEALDGKLNQGVQSLSVPAKAVVTPAVRDALKERGIELRRTDQETIQPNRKTPPVIVHTRQAVSAVWTSGGSESVDSLPTAVHRATARAKLDQMAILLCEQPEVAACAANRQNGVRALVVCGHGDWKTAVQALGANLVVCDPRPWNEADVPPLLAALGDLRTSAGPNWIP